MATWNDGRSRSSWRCRAVVLCGTNGHLEFFNHAGPDQFQSEHRLLLRELVGYRSFIFNRVGSRRRAKQRYSVSFMDHRCTHVLRCGSSITVRRLTFSSGCGFPDGHLRMGDSKCQVAPGHQTTSNQRLHFTLSWRLCPWGLLGSRTNWERPTVR